MVNIIQNRNNNDIIEPYTIKLLIIKIKKWVKYLKKNLKMILLISFLGGCLGLFYSYINKPTYKASISFVILDGSNNKINNGLTNFLDNTSFEYQKDNGLFSKTSFFQLIKSRMLIEKTLLSSVTIFHNKQKEVISFAEYYIRISDLKNTWKKDTKFSKIRFLPNSNRSTFSLDKNSALYDIYKSIITKNLIITQKDKISNVNLIEVSSNSEFFSKLFCVALVKEISSLYIQTKNMKFRKDVDILQNEIDSIDNEIRKSTKYINLANDNIYNLNPTLKVKKSYSILKQLEIENNKALLIQLSKQLELSKINLRVETPIIDVLDYPALPLEKTTLSKTSIFLLSCLLAGSISIICFLLFYLYNN